MALINTPTESTANEEIRPIFDAVRNIVSFVPKPTQMIGTSPMLLKQWWEYTQHFLRHAKLSTDLLRYIRLLVSVHGEFPFCTEFNTAGLKKMQVLSDEEVSTILRDPSQARLPENELALLLFVLRAVAEPEEVSADDVQALRAQGWSDEHIFEATYYGGWMLLLGLLFNAFKMHEA
jgi:hypothetical protein